MGDLQNSTADLQNNAETCAPTSTKSAQRSSRPVRYELLITTSIGPFDTYQQAVEHVDRFYPSFQHDQDRNGHSWDIAVTSD